MVGLEGSLGGGVVGVVLLLGAVGGLGWLCFGGRLAVVWSGWFCFWGGLWGGWALGVVWWVCGPGVCFSGCLVVLGWLCSGSGREVLGGWSVVGGFGWVELKQKQTKTQFFAGPLSKR